MIWLRLLLVAVVCLPLSGYAWWNDAWPYRAPIGIDTTPAGANITDTATEATVLIRLHSANFEDFFLVKEDLSDLRFISSDDKTPLKYHVESFDLLNQLAFIWVKVPQISGNLNTEKIWMYYGHAEAADGQDSTTSFDLNQAAVFHFGGPEALPQDNSAYGNHATLMEAETNPASLIASGVSFSGSGGMQIPDTPSLRVLADKGFTFSAWVKPQGVQSDSVIFNRQDGGNEVTVAIDQSALYARATLGGQTVETPRTAPLTLDTWQHLALVMHGDRMALSLNGLEVASVSVPLVEMGGVSQLGTSLGNTRGFVGEMDEVRLSNVARTPLQLLVSARSQGQGAALAFVGPAEQLGNAGGTSYFVTIFKNTGTEGWVVIFLLGIMAVLSWIVIAFKAMYLNRVVKDNKAFMAEYNRLSNQDITALDQDEIEEDSDSDIAVALFGDHDHFQSSPLYHVYHRGIQEVKGRLGTAVGAQATALQDSAVNAMRSSLEAYTVREYQRLNANMVLLTIAVSGGPFLGLLGTVLGVMITFAAIAASGDVNIAAIAPGVAAALLTTVAGLVVAIPALFGYNWLQTRIKAITADMHVFTDELIAKLAEQYGDS